MSAAQFFQESSDSLEDLEERVFLSKLLLIVLLISCFVLLDCLEINLEGQSGAPPWIALGSGSLLAHGCKACLELTGSSEQSQKAVFNFGKHAAISYAVGNLFYR